MATARIFKTGRSQAVRLPKEFRFSTRTVRVARVDGMVILYPPKQGWALLERAIGRFTKDFLDDRDQPAKAEERDTL